MKAPLLFTAGVVLGIAVGFVAWRVGSTADRDDSTVGEGQRRQSPGRPEARRGPGAQEVLSDFLKGRSPSDLTAEEAYQLVLPQFTQNWGGDPVERARQNYQRELLAAKLPLGTMEEVMEIARKNGKNRDTLISWFRAYVARDPDRAMAWSDGQPDAREWRGLALIRMADLDPARAREWYEKELMAGGSGLSGLNVVASQLAIEEAKQGHAAVFRLVESLPSDARSGALLRVASHLPEEEVAPFIEDVRKRVAEGLVEMHVLTGLLEWRTKSHPEQTREWMESLDPRTRSGMELRMASEQRALGNSKLASEHMKKAMDTASGPPKEFVLDAGSSLLFRDPELLADMVEMLPEDQKLTREDVARWSAHTHARPEAMLDVARFISSPEERAQYIAKSFEVLAQYGYNKSNAKDLELLSLRLAAMGLTGEAADTARDLVEQARERAAGK